jgi:hypothetical protein
MVSSIQPTLSRPELSKLRQLRAEVLAFQTKIAPLPAKDFSNDDNEKFNQLRREVKVVLKEAGFDKEVPRATTTANQFERVQKVIVPRLFGIMTIGVFLALVGLGVNSIILDQLLVNVMACLISSTGMLLVIGTFVVYQVNQSRNRLSNYADLYQRCEALLAQIHSTLDQTQPDWANQAHAIPTVAELALDSLHNLAADWETKLTTLETQLTNAGPIPPPELMASRDFVHQELNRVRVELEKLERQREVPLLAAQSAPPAMLSAGRPEPLTPAFREPVPKTEPSPEVIEQASAHTMGMPVAKVKAPPPPKKVEVPQSAPLEGPGAQPLDMPPVIRTEAPASAEEDTDADTATLPVDQAAQASAHTMGMPPVVTEDEPKPQAD